MGLRARNRPNWYDICSSHRFVLCNWIRPDSYVICLFLFFVDCYLTYLSANVELMVDACMNNKMAK